jgi:hypothetical protein
MKPRTAQSTVKLLILATMWIWPALGCSGAKKSEETTADPNARQIGNGSAPAGPAAADLSGGPPWVLGPCEQAFGEERSVVCGVGSVQGVTNFSLARSAAQGRGRTEIARKLQLRIQAVLTDYQTSSANETVEMNTGAPPPASIATDGDEDSQPPPPQMMNAASSAAVNEQMIQDTSQQITEMTLKGTTLAESWMSPSGVLFALMVLKSKDFAETLESSTDVPAPIKQIVLDNVPKLFSDYDE